ncbi:MAG: LysR family transcriptional regulator, partial [Pedobacter sp.]
DRATVSVGMCVETFQQALEKHIPKLDFNLIMQFGNNEQLTQSLEHGAVDLILTTSPSTTTGLIFTPFTVERFIIIAGKNTDVSAFKALAKEDKLAIKTWMKAQLWYSTAADMSVLNRFWDNNFQERPGFVPNYIVPNKFSIMRCLAEGDGLAILPDFLCKSALENNSVQKIWEGYSPVENTLYFGKRKQTLLIGEIQSIEQKLVDEFK